MRSWLKWGIPLAIVVLLGAAGGGVLLSQYVYRDTALAQRADVTPEPGGGGRSPWGIVYTAGAAAHPDLAAVQALLDNHFRSINEKNYDLWKSTVVRSKWLELPKDKWTTSYDTARDFELTVHRIDPGPDGALLVMLTFRSNQAIEDAPAQAKSTCVTWNVVYPLVLDETGQGLRLDTSKLPNSALFKPCE
ncbi:hypothetical protein [Saccharopolyspora shandongensis]|uniref:Uncharacterized protein n=1 Tax=Saccharopolyspora shandongensis TaxID=418495 RepID=A0A1H3M8G1_9PSEU|nr:hypothetical protein [Saccharopolyspora shandongensis]SDY73002.1 hypothetical protein SAMN05216215_1033101 [Saccharopolyspora shandongensis]